MWHISENDLESIAIGAGILGTGGGGNPYIGMLRARQMIRENGPVRFYLPMNSMKMTISFVSGELELLLLE